MSVEDVSSDETALAPPAGTVLTFGPFCLTVTGVETVRESTFEEWEQAFKWVQAVDGCLQFWLGDLLEYGENHWGQKYSQALEATEYAEKTLRNATWVARQIPKERRRLSAKVTYGHHVEVAGLEPDRQEYWLTRCEAEELTRDQLRAALKAERLSLTGGTGEYWLLVKCADEVDQLRLAEEMRQQGRTVKPR